MKYTLLLLVSILFTVDSYSQNNSFNVEYYQAKWKIQYIHDTSENLKSRIDNSILQTKDLFFRSDLYKVRETLKPALNKRASIEDSEQYLILAQKSYNTAVRKHDKRFKKLSREWRRQFPYR